MDVLERYYFLLDELCRGLDMSRHVQFGFMRLRAEFETSGEIFGCTLEELRERAARRLPESARRPGHQPKTALERLRERVSAEGHPDLR